MKLLLIFAAFAASLQATVIASINGTLDASNTAVCPGIVSCTGGTQTGRLTRNNIQSTWDAPKSNPGLVMGVTLSYEFDAYSFFNSLAVPVYYQVELTAADGLNQFVEAYNSAGFVPANPTNNYLADPGTSTGHQLFQFIVPAGQFTTIVVNATNGGVYTGDYNLTISGFLDKGLTNLDGSSTGAPEPTSIAMSVVGLSVLALAALRKRRQIRLT